MKAKKLTTAEKIRRALAADPTASTNDIAKKFGVRYQTVWTIRKNMAPKKITLTKTQAAVANKLGITTKMLALQELKKIKGLTAARRAEIERQIKAEAENTAPVVGTGNEYEQKDGKWQAVEPVKADNVNHPAHYKVGGIETIDFIEAKSLSYHLGNAVKYITRADHKGNRLEDLQKARWYLDREISKTQGA